MVLSTLGLANPISERLLNKYLLDGPIRRAGSRLGKWNDLLINMWSSFIDSSKELSKNLLLANLANGNTVEAKKYAAAADAQAKAAMAAAEGDYKAAAKNLEGYNAAIALVQSNDLAGAKKAIAKDNSADADYLRAVIAAKEGDLKTAEAQLKSAVSKNPALAQKAAKDINLKALKK